MPGQPYMPDSAAPVADLAQRIAAHPAADALTPADLLALHRAWLALGTVARAHGISVPTLHRACARCGEPITDPENAPADHTALCRACGDPDDYPDTPPAGEQTTLEVLA